MLKIGLWTLVSKNSFNKFIHDWYFEYNYEIREVITYFFTCISKINRARIDLEEESKSEKSIEDTMEHKESLAEVDE